MAACNSGWWTCFRRAVGTPEWAADTFGQLVGTLIAAGLALYVLRVQLVHDRRLVGNEKLASEASIVGHKMLDALQVLEKLPADAIEQRLRTSGQVPGWSEMNDAGRYLIQVLGADEVKFDSLLTRWLGCWYDLIEDTNNATDKKVSRLIAHLAERTPRAQSILSGNVYAEDQLTECQPGHAAKLCMRDAGLEIREVAGRLIQWDGSGPLPPLESSWHFGDNVHWHQLYKLELERAWDTVLRIEYQNGISPDPAP